MVAKGTENVLRSQYDNVHAHRPPKVDLDAEVPSGGGWAPLYRFGYELRQLIKFTGQHFGVEARVIRA
jgi:hypothetical protein